MFVQAPKGKKQEVKKKKKKRIPREWGDPGKTRYSNGLIGA